MKRSRKPAKRTPARKPIRVCGRQHEDREPAQTYTKLADRDPAMAAEFTRILAPIVPVPTPNHAIPGNPAPAGPPAHAQPKPEPTWLRATGEVLIYTACILIALPAGAVLLDTFVWLAIRAWAPVGRVLGAS